jgi:hypothetical protein
MSKPTYIPIDAMAVRTYLASMAPDAIPEWYDHEPPDNRPATSPSWMDLREDLRDEGRFWANEGGAVEDAPESIREWAQSVVDSESQWEEWKSADLAARYFQWRWFYADSMMAVGGVQ